MSRSQFTILLIIALACLGLAAAGIVVAHGNQALQAELQAQQAEINKGTTSQRVGLNLVRAMAVSARKNDNLKSLLDRHGYKLREDEPAETSADEPEPAASPSPTPTPSPTTTPRRR